MVRCSAALLGHRSVYGLINGTKTCLVFTPDFNKPALNKIIDAAHPQRPQISNLPFNSHHCEPNERNILMQKRRNCDWFCVKENQNFFAATISKEDKKVPWERVSAGIKDVEVKTSGFLCLNCLFLLSQHKTQGAALCYICQICELLSLLNFLPLFQGKPYCEQLPMERAFASHRKKELIWSKI